MLVLWALVIVIGLAGWYIGSSVYAVAQMIRAASDLHNERMGELVASHEQLVELIYKRLRDVGNLARALDMIDAEHRMTEKT